MGAGMGGKWADRAELPMRERDGKREWESGAVQAMASCNPLEFRRRRKRPRQSHRAPEFLRAGWEGRTPLWPSKKTHAAIATARDEMQIARCRSIDSDSRARQEISVTAPIINVIHQDGSGRGQGCSEAKHDARREAKIILRDSENKSEQPVSLHSPSHPFDQLVIKPAPDGFGK